VPRALPLLLIALLLAGCATSATPEPDPAVTVGSPGRPVLIVAYTPNETVRVRFEERLESDLAVKGIAAVWLGKGLAVEMTLEQAQLIGIVALLGAIVGHSFSVFLKFRGGKGVATTIGGLAALMWPVVLAGLVVWVVVFYATKYVSLASILLGVSLPITALVLQRSVVDIWFCVFLTVLIVVRHLSNIRRLLAGTENRAGKQSS